jgi:FdhD protein
MTDTEKPYSEIRLTKLKQQRADEVDDIVASEEPLEIRLGYNDPLKGKLHKSLSITMRTPGDDINLVCGFLYSESIIRHVEDIADIDDDTDNVVRVELNDDVSFDVQRLDRHFYTTSSCGVCGKASLDALSTSGYDALLDNTFTMNREKLFKVADKLREKQSLFERTGGCHGVATFNGNGEIVTVAEDVGRHNAMDKLVGSMLRSHLLPIEDMGIIVSGRASFELMQKALTARCPMLVAVGAPSSLAIELAQEFNICLIGFLNDKTCNIYNCPENVL